MTQAPGGFYSPGLSEFVRTVLISGAPSAIVEVFAKGQCYVGCCVRWKGVGLRQELSVCLSAKTNKCEVRNNLVWVQNGFDWRGVARAVGSSSRGSGTPPWGVGLRMRIHVPGLSVNNDGHSVYLPSSHPQLNFGCQRSRAPVNLGRV